MIRKIAATGLALSLFLSGCGQSPQPTNTPMPSPLPTQAPTPTPTPLPTATPLPTQTPKPTDIDDSFPTPLVPWTELDYQTETTGYTINRIKLDSKELALNVYYEIPEFHTRGDGYQKINAYFQALADAFYSPENTSLDRIWETAHYMSGLYYKWTAQVTFLNDQMVSVTLSYQWMAGGVLDQGSNGYTFRTDTGELLTLSEVTGKPNDELKEAILDALTLEYADTEPSYLEDIMSHAQEYTVDDFDFAVDDRGYIQIYLDRYELGRIGADSATTIYPWLMAASQWDAWK